MAREAAEAPSVFAGAATQPVDLRSDQPAFKAIYTIARGSSDAAATILAYEFMAHLRVPVTSLPPSIFSLGDGVDLAGCMTMVVSQSGASDDLVKSAQGTQRSGAAVFAITNVAAAPVEKYADAIARIGAGPELAVPATKSVIGSVAAGMAILAALDPRYRGICDRSARQFQTLARFGNHPKLAEISAALLRAQHVYVIGRGSGYGTAQEVALKLKETCVLHAEAYSASEVLHGPLQLVTNPLLVLIMDTCEPKTQDSIDIAEARFRAAGSTVYRFRMRDMGCDDMAPAAAAAALLHAMYPVILATSLSLGLNPDAPANLAKITRTT
jgi:glucosamine--fructose-6-phosphate aminotransferase (isomerizing)